MDRTSLSGSVTVPSEGVAFTSRGGGVSKGRFEGLNLSLDVGDDDADVMTNRRLLSDHLGISHRWTSVKQVHGSNIHILSEGQQVEERVEADAIISRSGGTLVVFVADCVPIALEGTDGFAVVHGGWRSLSAGIIDQVCDQIRATTAWIGPCIRPCHYTVGPEVGVAFASRYPGVPLAQEREGTFDLSTAARALLDARSVDVAFQSSACTGCEDWLYSYRRSTTTGRQAVVMWR